MKLKSFIFAVVLAFVLMLEVGARVSPLHTFHTSLMQVEYNEKEQLVEISLQVFTHDLENVLSQRSGKNVRLDKTPEASQLTLTYLNDTVNLKNREGQIKTLSWVGMESQADAVWLYVETKMPEGIEGLQVRDRIFFATLDDQLNLVHIKHEKEKYDLVFKRGDDFKPLPPTTHAAS